MALETNLPSAAQSPRGTAERNPARELGLPACALRMMGWWKRWENVLVISKASPEAAHRASGTLVTNLSYLFSYSSALFGILVKTRQRVFNSLRTLFALPKNSTSLFSSVSALLAKNTRGGGTPLKENLEEKLTSLDQFGQE